MQEIQVRSLGPEDPLEEGMATHSSILALRIPWTDRSLAGYTVHGVTQSQTRLSTHAWRATLKVWDASSVLTRSVMSSSLSATEL